MGQGKDRGKHDGGRDASGRIPPGAKHPDSPRNPGHQPAREEQPESGTVREERSAGQRSPSEEDI